MIVPVMPLVEIVQGLATSHIITQKIVQFVKLLEKEVSFSKDTPGFVSNRLLMPYINEAIFALSEVWLISDN